VAFVRGALSCLAEAGESATLREIARERADRTGVAA
jgi:hypothetical protein